MSICVFVYCFFFHKYESVAFGAKCFVDADCVGGFWANTPPGMRMCRSTCGMRVGLLSGFSGLNHPRATLFSKKRRNDDPAPRGGNGVFFFCVSLRELQKGCCAAFACQRPVRCILEAYPTSAESAQINLLCCQPGSVSRTSPA